MPCGISKEDFLLQPTLPTHIPPKNNQTFKCCSVSGDLLDCLRDFFEFFFPLATASLCLKLYLWRSARTFSTICGFMPFEEVWVGRSYFFLDFFSVNSAGEGAFFGGGTFFWGRLSVDTYPPRKFRFPTKNAFFELKKFRGPRFSEFWLQNVEKKVACSYFWVSGVSGLIYRFPSDPPRKLLPKPCSRCPVTLWTCHLPRDILKFRNPGGVEGAYPARGGAFFYFHRKPLGNFLDPQNWSPKLVPLSPPRGWAGECGPSPQALKKNICIGIPKNRIESDRCQNCQGNVLCAFLFPFFATLWVFS